MRYLATALILVTFVGGLSAQEFTDTFGTPSPGAPAGWTAKAGTWSVAGGHLKTNGASTWSYITKDGFNPVNCVIDIEAFYNASGVQFAGSMARYASSSAVVMCKIQENTTATQDFDRSFIYEQGGAGSTWADLTTKVTGSAYVRLIVCGNQCWMEHDFDKDGAYDQTIGPKTLTSQLGAGLVGANAYGISEIDNWEYFNAVLKPQANATPKIGGVYNMDLVATSQQKSWYGALSTGNGGFPIGTRRIPLTPDALMTATLQIAPLFGLTGVTDAMGKATVGLIIPNESTLIGVRLFCGVITVDQARPQGIDNISNEVAITFVS